MPDSYEVYEGRFINQAAIGSGVNGHVCTLTAVPTNVVRTILSAHIDCGVSDTQNFWFAILRGSVYYAITSPTNVALVPAVNKYHPLVREGMEVKLFPNESLCALREDHAVGSEMWLHVRYIDSPLPLYEEYEPQLRRAQIRKRGSSGQRSVGGGYGGGGEAGIIPPAPPGGGEGGGGEPVL